MKLRSLLTLALAGAIVPVLHSEDAALSIGQFSFKLEAPWKKAENTGMMTKAVLQYPVEGGEPMEAKFYDFGGPSGGIEANVQRWIGMFQGAPDVKKEELTFGTTKVMLVTVSGTFMDGPPGGAKTAKPDHTLCGAILAGEQSNVFIKFTGPKAPMEKARESFKKLATSPFPAK
jgi:hypothetical protein